MRRTRVIDARGAVAGTYLPRVVDCGGIDRDPVSLEIVWAFSEGGPRVHRILESPQRSFPVNDIWHDNYQMLTNGGDLLSFSVLCEIKCPRPVCFAVFCRFRGIGVVSAPAP